MLQSVHFLPFNSWKYQYCFISWQMHLLGDDAWGLSICLSLQTQLCLPMDLRRSNRNQTGTQGMGLVIFRKTPVKALQCVDARAIMRWTNLQLLCILSLLTICVHVLAIACVYKIVPCSDVLEFSIFVTSVAAMISCYTVPFECS